VLLASSSEVYGKSTRTPFRESDDLHLGPAENSRWCYGMSKLVGEQLALAEHRQYGSEITIARLFNTIGPRQVGDYGMVVPRFVSQALAGEPLTVYGDGSQTRCLCDVEDVAPFLLRMATHPAANGRVFNVGSDVEISILELAQRIVSIAGSDSSIHTVPYEKVYAPGFEDLERRVPDLSRARETLGWAPRISLEASLSRILSAGRRDDDSAAWAASGAS